MINHRKEPLRCTYRLSKKTNFYRKIPTLNKDDAKCRCICTNRSKYASLKRYNLSTCLFETTDPINADPIYSSQSGYTCMRDDQPLQPNPRGGKERWLAGTRHTKIDFDRSRYTTQAYNRKVKRSCARFSTKNTTRR